LEIYRDYLRLFPDVPEALSRLTSHGRHMAIVTSRMPRTLGLYLETTGISQYFEALVTPRDTKKHKPDPEPALKALSLLKGMPDRALFVGDATFDIECGYNAGMDTAFVAWSHNDVSSLAVTPTHVLASLLDLCDERPTGA
jgi:pyrophosphatase PpaX